MGVDKTPTIQEAAREYLARGWFPVPIPQGLKRASLPDWPNLRVRTEQVDSYFDNDANLGLILGEASGGLVDVDLDCREAMELADDYLPPTPAVSGRPSKPASHRWYISDVPGIKQYKDPLTKKMIVELRSNGGQTVVGPSLHPDGERYDRLTGDPAHVPAGMLKACVEALYDAVVKQRYPDGVPTKSTVTPRSLSPRNDEDPARVEERAIAYLAKMPAAISGQGGHSATYAAAVALAHGFAIEPERALQILLEDYNPRCEPPWTEKELAHKVSDAVSKSHDKPRGWLRDSPSPPPFEDRDVDLSGIIGAVNVNSTSFEPVRAGPADPGPIPEELLHIPGFVNDVMQFTLATAPYPNRPLAFIGAIALLGTLTGRKVREPGNVRTNVQILALASSGVGKDWPRKVNSSILLHADETRKLAGKSASGEGIEDRLIGHPIILKQDDEIDTLFENMRDNKEARYRNQFGMLLELYGEAGGWRAIRDRAGEKSGLIYQPHLVLFGTTTPGEFYASLSGKMLNKGLLARLITVEAGVRGRRKRPDWRDPPESIVAVAKQWSTFWPPGWGNLSDESCGQATPLVVAFTDDAQRAIDAFADRCDDAYSEAAKRGNEPVMAIWARAVEKATQLSLIYACSQHGITPVIELPAVNWSSAFVEHTIRRTIFMLGEHFHESEFEQKCQEIVQTLTKWQRENGEEWMPYLLIARKHRWPRREHDAIREALIDQELIQTDWIKQSGAGRPRHVYRLYCHGSNITSQVSAQSID